MANHERYLKIAGEIAQTSDFKNYKVGCIVIYKNSIISSASNSNKTHTMQSRYNKYRNIKEGAFPAKVHAEMSAISKIRYLDIDWSKVTVYVTRNTKSNSYGMARPCASCMAAIKEKGIKNIVYSTDNGYAIERIYK